MRGFSKVASIALAAVALAALGGASQAAAAVDPSVTLDSVSEVSYESVHLAGTVDPGERDDVNWAIRYSTDGIHWFPERTWTGETFAANSGPHPVEGTLTGLAGGTHYFVKLITGTQLSEETEQPFSSAVQQIDTLPVTPPTVVSIDPASEISYTSAKLSGKVERPSGNADPAFDARCRFEYVDDGQFGQNGFESAVKLPCNPQRVTAEGVEEPVQLTLGNLTPGATYHFRMTAFNAGGSDTLVGTPFTTTAVSTPAVTIDPITGITGTSAHFSGTIDPELGGGDPSLYAVKWKFVCEPACPGLSGEISAAEVDNAPHAVSADATLVPNTEYKVELVASNAGETGTAGPLIFKTAALPPIVQTLDAGVIGPHSAVLSARINPMNSPTAYQFEWGAAGAGYEHVVPVSPGALPAVYAFRHVSTPLLDLQEGVAYHYRVVATNTLTGEVSHGTDRTFSTNAATAPSGCPNEASRVGPSTGLPDCRAYEWVSRGLANTNTITSGSMGIYALADGSALKYVTFDAPDDAQGSTISQPTVSRRGPDGWETHSLGVLTPQPSEFFASVIADGLVSPDFKESLFWSTTSVDGSRPRGEKILYLRRADGTALPLTNTGPTIEGPIQQITGEAGLSHASGDFSHIFVAGAVGPQLPGDPVVPFNTYDWTEAGGLRLLGILPSEGSTPEAPAPEGAVVAEGALPASSQDGKEILFQALENNSSRAVAPPLYLRENGEETVEVTRSQRSTPESGPPKNVVPVGITADGSTVLFLSSSELTDDANTGETAGVNNNKGADLYSYDVGTGALTDLTVDHDSQDAATGANVISFQNSPWASPDGETIYFVATGDLAPGAVSGEPNLYVLRGGVIRFVTPAGGMVRTGGVALRGFYASPDGRHAAFISTDDLTGYRSGGKSEVFEYSYDSNSIVCASCRPKGEPPSVGSGFRFREQSFEEASEVRAMSDDGSRVFFSTTDAVLPGLTDGVARVYEYSHGKTALVSPADATAPTYYFGSSASGDDVFLATYEELASGPGRTFAIYDARVGADVAQPTPPACRGEACRGPGSTAVAGPPVGSGSRRQSEGILGPKSRSARSKTIKLRIGVPASGRLTISGKGIASAKKQVGEPGTVTLVARLTSSADKKRRKAAVFRTSALIRFTPAAGQNAIASKVTVRLTYRGQTTKGRK